MRDLIVLIILVYGFIFINLFLAWLIMKMFGEDKEVEG